MEKTEHNRLNKLIEVVFYRAVFWDNQRLVRNSDMYAAEEKGRMARQEEIARNALAEGSSIEFLQKITGLDLETIKSLQTKP